MSLGGAIRASIKHFDSLPSNAPGDYIEAVIDDETEKIEDLLGVAFIICQIYITKIISAVMSLRKRANGRDSIDLTTTNGEKIGIMQFGSSQTSTQKYSPITMLDAFANYYKHRDEWKGDWNILTGRAAKTVKIIASAGASRGSTGNLRTGATYLKNSNYHSFHVFVDYLSEWQNKLTAAYKEELKEKRLL